MTKTRGKKNAHTGSVRGKTPPVEPQAVSAPPPVDREQRIISNEPFHPANDSPRTKQAKQSVNRLKQLDIWDPLTSVHRKLCSLDDPDFTTNATTFVDLIFKAHAELKDIIPEFKSITDKPRLATVARNVYSNLAAEIASYSDVDKALSLVLVHVARTLPAPKLSQEDIEDNAHTSAQFGCAYYGNTPDRFLESVTEHDRKFNELDPSKGKIYLRGTSIVQSSGTGKSRMVYECRHRTPLLYVCVRPTTADGLAMKGYPLADRGVRAFFEEAQKTHKDLCNLQIACFLGAWFSELAQRLAKLPTQQQKHDYLMQLNRLDNNAGENPQRIDFFLTVSELASDTLADADRSLNDRDDDLFGHYIRSPLRRLESEMKAIITHMNSLSPHHTASATLPVLVAFDDYVELNVDGVDEVNNPVKSLRRAWNYITRLQSCAGTPNFFLLLIGTSFEASRLF
ncbi:uncharacterized protein UMAG_05436 [Mycosarcoma maydis]|uniref:Uncharacterized protein n=1 Tax=Mycosarcoma maydis TaxID=5270 RepID=A0A0D1DV75_MYCMD|nr:uncharacterized protein UMAG_05436 [Ustilago maydis 521]KIS66445.1 hypothetical protein UMAG_05436 [Ustilago maydis 521]|eukprot:XP_011391786.1 hypothetical protein UMAG_05436 [Ustilago maydis 521]